MKRKVIQIADSTLLISLPKKWADAQGIKKGNDIDVEVQGSKLVVSPDNEPLMEKTQIALEDSSRFLRRSIDVLYKYGYDEVEVTFKDPKVTELVQDCLDELMGYEVVNKSPTSLTLRDITFGRDVEFDAILKRVFFMLIELGKNVHDALKENDKEKFAELAKYDTLINKFTNFCERLLNKKGYHDHKRTTLIYYLVCILEEIGDEYKGMCKYIANNTSYAPSDVVISICQLTNEHFRSFFELHYKFTHEGLFKLKQQKDAIDEKITNHLKTSAGVKDAIMLYRMLTIVMQIRNMSARVL